MVDPPLKLAAGGWSFAHGATKAALHRMAGILHLEYGDRGIRAYNLEPGLVRSESLIASLGEDTELEKMGVKSAPVEVPAAVIRWLCTADEAASMSGGSWVARASRSTGRDPQGAGAVGGTLSRMDRPSLPAAAWSCVCPPAAADDRRRDCRGGPTILPCTTLVAGLRGLDRGGVSHVAAGSFFNAASVVAVPRGTGHARAS